MIFRRLAKDSAIYGGADLLTKLLSFFAFPLIAAELSPKAFGALELIATVTALLALVLNCGINNGVQRFYWDKETIAVSQPAIVTSGFSALFFIGLLMLFVGVLSILVLLPLVRMQNWPLTWVALVAALFVMVFSQWCQYFIDVMRLHFAPWRYFTFSFISRVFTLGCGLVAVVWFGLGIDGLLAAQALVLVSVLPLALWMIKKDFDLRRIDLVWVKELVRFGHPFIFAGLAYWLFGAMDRWMLAAMSSVEEVGVYSVSFRFASAVLFVSAAFGQAWSPIAIKIRTENPDNYRTIYGQVLVLLLFVMLVVGGGIALFSGEIISLIMPSEYYSSALPFAILCFSVILQATQQVTAVGISLEKKTYLFARLTWFATMVNFILNLVLIPKFGAVGAAWGTLVAYIILTGSYMYFTLRLHPIVIKWEALGVLVLLGIITLVVAITYNSLELNWQVLLLKVAIALGCVYFGWRVLPMRSMKKFTK